MITAALKYSWHFVLESQKSDNHFLSQRELTLFIMFIPVEVILLVSGLLFLLLFLLLHQTVPYLP